VSARWEAGSAGRGARGRETEERTGSKAEILHFHENRSAMRVPLYLPWPRHICFQIRHACGAGAPATSRARLAAANDGLYTPGSGWLCSGDVAGSGGSSTDDFDAVPPQLEAAGHPVNAELPAAGPSARRSGRGLAYGAAALPAVGCASSYAPDFSAAAVDWIRHAAAIAAVSKPAWRPSTRAEALLQPSYPLPPRLPGLVSCEG
jgi:hypothetical protein